MVSRTLKSDLLLLLTAGIWGFAFVAQRVGMEYVGPFTFNGVRFALGSLSLVPLLVLTKSKSRPDEGESPLRGSSDLWWGGGLAGLLLFSGASLQQVGLVYTTAGNAGFITGLYVVIVPLMGLFLRQRTTVGTWLGACLAASGLYFLSVTDQFTIAWGDFLEVVGAFFWAGHVLAIGWLSPRMAAIKLAIIQFAACSILSLATAAIFEDIVLSDLRQAAVPILYGGVASVGVAYTLQVVAQKHAHPAHAAIFLSLEAVFAAFGGWLLLGEVLSYRGLWGCALMLAGMLLSQLWGLWLPTGAAVGEGALEG
ncbi:MAG: DMT family transporter [Desulfobacterales bacterium]|jgi:drug/metabolite transporter (DMT)-like permease